MKHSWMTTIILLSFFLLTQIIGLVLVSMAMPVSVSPDGSVVVSPPETAVGPPPQTTELGALFLLLAGITIGTLLILLLVKLRKYNLWKFWFLLAAAMTMTISFGVLFGSSNYFLAAALGLLLALWKVFWPNPYVHNFTELFIYPGMAVLFYHILSVPVMLVLLAIISVYDVIAVYKSKHMVAMADFQNKSTVFAGLAIPRANNSQKTQVVQKATTRVSSQKIVKKSSKKTGGTAILGGGDIALPLLFAAVVMRGLVEGGVDQISAFLLATIISLMTALALLLLFVTARQGRYYPAMPAVSAGAIFGWLIILVLTM